MASNRLHHWRGLTAAALTLTLAVGAMLPVLAEEGMVNPMLGDQAAIDGVRKTYRQRCYICHLSQGGRGPNLFATTLSDEKFLMTVINGRKGASMPAFGLQMSPDEVWEVNAYVRSTDHYE